MTRSHKGAVTFEGRFDTPRCPAAGLCRCATSWPATPDATLSGDSGRGHHPRCLSSSRSWRMASTARSIVTRCWSIRTRPCRIREGRQRGQYRRRVAPATSTASHRAHRSRSRGSRSLGTLFPRVFCIAANREFSRVHSSRVDPLRGQAFCRPLAATPTCTWCSSPVGWS